MSQRIFVLSETYQQAMEWCSRAEVEWLTGAGGARPPAGGRASWVSDSSRLRGDRCGDLVVLPGAWRRRDYDEVIAVARCREMNIRWEADA